MATQKQPTRKPTTKTPSKTTKSTKSTGTTTRKTTTKTSASPKPTAKERRAAAAKQERQDAIITSIILFALGLLLIVMLFVPGASAWNAIRTFLFGLFGISFYFMGVAILYIAVLVAQQERCLAPILKMVFGMAVFSGLAILFSKFEMTDRNVFQTIVAFYQNGVDSVFGGGMMGMLMGAPLLLLCGRPAANILMVILLICVVMLFTGITPAEIADFLDDRFGSAKEHGAAARDALLAEQERRAIARQERLAEEEEENLRLAIEQAKEQENEAKQRSIAQAVQRAIPQVYDCEQDVGNMRPSASVPTAQQPQYQLDQMTPPTTLKGEKGKKLWERLFARKGGANGVNVPDSVMQTGVDIGGTPNQTQAQLPNAQSKPLGGIEIGAGGTFGLESVQNAMANNPRVVGYQTVGEPTVEVGADEFWQTPVANDAVAQTTPPTWDNAFSQDSAVIPPSTGAQDGGWMSMRDTATSANTSEANGGVSNPADIANLAALAMAKPAMDSGALPTAPTQASTMQASTMQASTMQGTTTAVSPIQAIAQMESVPEEELLDTYQYPPIDLFALSRESVDRDAEIELKANAQKLVDTLDSFGVKTQILDISRGPSVTRYELQPSAGVKISRITNLADDIALNLSVAGVRMEAPIPGKPAVGIEVPNRKSTSVGMRSLLESKNYTHMQSPLCFALGKDIAGVAQVADLCKMPHLLVAGSTGSGKSVCINSIIISFLFRASPEEVKLILIDPKVVELAEYNGIPHLLMPVVTEPRKAAGALSSAVGEMEKRYRMFAENNVRDIKTFNKLAEERDDLEKMPYIAIIIDELADLMMVAGKEVEDYICRIAQKARAAGMHLVVATQRPSVDVITGLIKANIPSRISFAVSSQIDSRTILDSAGAEKLLGMGDMLFMPVGAPKPTRIQGTYVKDEEISRVLAFLKEGGAAEYDEEMIAEMEKVAANQKGAAGKGGAEKGAEQSNDPMLKQCAEVVIDAGQASTSLLQRRCKLGYARAARIMDEMEQLHIIGPYEGAKPRAVLVSRQQWLEMTMREQDGVQ